MKSVVIQGGTIVDPASNLEGEFDLLISDGVIEAIEKPGSIPASKERTVVNAAGKWVVPGMIDLHVHLREPGFEWKETIATGCEAAIRGGFTSICAMPNTRPVNDCAEVTRFMLQRAREAGTARVLPIGAVSIGLQGKEMAPLSELARAGCVAFSDDGEPVWDAGLMRRALEWVQVHGLAISCHEEDKHLSCGGCMNESSLSLQLGLKGMHTVAEDVMVARDIELARVTKGKVHICHISSARGVELVRRAKNDGIAITCEVTPHHLTLSEDAVQDYDTHAKMSPPLREWSDIEGLRAGLKDGTIDAVASDHAPHEADTKQVEFARASMGILGLQTSLPLLVEFVAQGMITRRRAVEVLTSAPARCFGLEAGTLKKGRPADVVVVDPKHRWSFSLAENCSLSKNSPFIGRELTGIADTVLVGGKILILNRERINGEE